jgi:hypothetical protein
MPVPQPLVNAFNSLAQFNSSFIADKINNVPVIQLELQHLAGQRLTFALDY